MGIEENCNKIRNLVIEHNKWFQESLPMIASENLLSPLAREMLSCDFEDRYAEGHPMKRYYQGCIYIDQVEDFVIELGKKLFNAKYIDVRPISGTVANLAIYNALTKPGDIISALATAQGAHISHAKFGGAGVCGLNVVNYPFDEKNMNIDVDATIKLLNLVKPKIALFGQSVYLFPTPLKEVSEVVHSNNGYVVYDGAHVLGLISGGKFQNPLREGADVITGSTHKTLPGPQGGIIISDSNEQEFLKKLDYGVFPGVVSNHHLHHLAAKGIAFAEHLEYGKQYAEQVVKNAKVLGRYMYELGFKVFCEHLDFTESHQIVIDVGYEKGRECAQKLEQGNVIVNMNMIPGDKKPLRPSGLRIGVQELTRIGMRESEMQEVAEIFKKILFDNDIASAIAKVKALRKEFNKIHYCFNSDEAHKYYYLVK